MLWRVIEPRQDVNLYLGGREVRLQQSTPSMTITTFTLLCSFFLNPPTCWKAHIGEQSRLVVLEILKAIRQRAKTLKRSGSTSGAFQSIGSVRFRAVQVGRQRECRGRAVEVFGYALDPFIQITRRSIASMALNRQSMGEFLLSSIFKSEFFLK